MAGIETSSVLRSRNIAFQGFLFLILTSVIALLEFRIGAIHLSFLAIPLAVIFLWPRGSEPALSAGLIVFGGLLFDLASGGPLGLWPLLYLITFMVIRPNKRGRNLKRNPLWAGFAVWLLVLTVIVLLLALLSENLTFSSWAWTSQMCMALAAFPAIYAIRRKLRIKFTDPSDRLDEVES